MSQQFPNEHAGDAEKNCQHMNVDLIPLVTHEVDSIFNLHEASSDQLFIKRLNIVDFLKYFPVTIIAKSNALSAAAPLQGQQPSIRSHVRDRQTGLEWEMAE